MGGFPQRRAEGQIDHLLDLVGLNRQDARRSGLVVQKAVDALLMEAIAPAPDNVLGGAELADDGVGPEPIIGRQNDSGSGGLALGGVAVPNDRFKPLTIRN